MWRAVAQTDWLIGPTDNESPVCAVWHHPENLVPDQSRGGSLLSTGIRAHENITYEI